MTLPKSIYKEPVIGVESQELEVGS